MDENGSYTGSYGRTVKIGWFTRRGTPLMIDRVVWCSGCEDTHQTEMSSLIHREYVYEDPTMPSSFPDEIVKTDIQDEIRKVTDLTAKYGGRNPPDHAVDRLLMRGIIEWAERNPEVWNRISIEIDKAHKSECKGSDQYKLVLGQNVLLKAVDSLLTNRDVGFNEIFDGIHPTIFQIGQAIQMTYTLLKREKEQSKPSLYQIKGKLK